jgi:hypothetical protein
MSEVGQPAQCNWKPLIGQCEITAYVMSAGSWLSSFFILIAFVAFSFIELSSFRTFYLTEDSNMYIMCNGIIFHDETNVNKEDVGQ